MYNKVDFSVFSKALAHARVNSALIAYNTATVDELRTVCAEVETEFYVSDDMLSGFAVTYTGLLVGVFSRVKGRGDTLLRHATYRGATHLDCFDGYLRTLYERHGFHVSSRVSNWNPGGPDVCFMKLENHIG